MTIDVAFLSAFVLKSNLQQYYPGGLPAFSEDFPCHRADDQLVRLSAMSGGELREDVGQLIAREAQKPKVWLMSRAEAKPGIVWHLPHDAVDIPADVRAQFVLNDAELANVTDEQILGAYEIANEVWPLELDVLARAYYRDEGKL